MKHKSLLFALPMVATMSLTSCGMNQEARLALWKDAEAKLFNVGTYRYDQEKVLTNLLNNFSYKFKITVESEIKSNPASETDRKTKCVEHFDFIKGYYDSSFIDNGERYVKNVGQIHKGHFYNLDITHYKGGVDVFVDSTSKGMAIDPTIYMRKCFDGTNIQMVDRFAWGFGHFFRAYLTLPFIFKEEASLKKQVGNYVLKYSEKQQSDFGKLETSNEVVFDNTYVISKFNTESFSSIDEQGESRVKTKLIVEVIDNIDYLDYSEYIKM